MGLIWMQSAICAVSELTKDVRKKEKMNDQKWDKNGQSRKTWQGNLEAHCARLEYKFVIIVRYIQGQLLQIKQFGTAKSIW